MEILLLSDKPPWPPDSGGAYAVLSMIREISGAGIKPALLSYNTSKHQVTYDDIPKDIKSQAEIYSIDVNNRVSPPGLIRNLLFTRLPYNIYRYDIEIYKKKLESLLAERDFDIIQFEGLAVCRYMETIKPISKAKLVYRAHNVEYQLWNDRSRYEKNPIRSIYLKNLSRRTELFELGVINECDGLLAISDDDLNHFKEKGYMKRGITAYPTFNIPDIPVKNPERKSQGRILSFIGALDWQPNIDGLLWFIDEVLPIIIDSDPEIQFHIAGRGASQHLIKRINRSTSTYVGTPVDSAAFLLKSDIVVAPLFSGSGIRIKILEALSLGKSVITTSTGARGLPYDIKELLLIEDNPLKFSKLVIDQLNNPSGNIPAEKQNVFKSNFGNLATTNRLKEFYSNLLNDN